MKRLLFFLILFSCSLFSTAQKADFKTAEKLILIRKDRQLKNLDVCLVNAETGVLSVLFSEETWPYFNNEYTRLSVLNEGNDFPYFDRIMWYYFAEHLLGDYRNNVDIADF